MKLAKLKLGANTRGVVRQSQGNHKRSDQKRDDFSITEMRAETNNVIGIKRWSVAGLVAAVITFGLGVSMAHMIATEFQAQDKLKTAAFEINPVEDDIFIESRKIKIDPYKDVETPPPPPRIDTAKTEKVKVSPMVLKGDKDVIDLPPIKMAMVTSINHDKDYQPILRFPPKMPNLAIRSGHCYVRFDVSPEGAPYNIRTTSCSETIFSRETIRSVEKWQYVPRRVDGRSVSVQGVTTRVTFKLTDEAGDIIPEKV
jgi:protein TonB